MMPEHDVQMIEGSVSRQGKEDFASHVVHVLRTRVKIMPTSASVGLRVALKEPHSGVSVLDWI